MIELWSWPAPNGQKVHILLEETGLPYTVTPVNTGATDQMNQDLLDITTNYRIPAILDSQGRQAPMKLCEAGAILIYLAEKAGNFIPVDPDARYICLQWLMFQLSGIGPAFQHYRQHSSTEENNPATVEPLTQEVQRLVGVLEKRLEEDDYLAGTYSIADMAVYPWIAAASAQAINLDAFPATKRWTEKLAARPAVGRGMTLMQELQEN
jgi:GSH-dependent disulfide-bond oxidoreductase